MDISRGLARIEGNLGLRLRMLAAPYWKIKLANRVDVANH